MATQTQRQNDESETKAAAEPKGPERPDHLSSINEPDGSADPPVQPAPPAPLALTAISPTSAVVGSALDLVLTATGEGFTAASVIVFDDEEMPTTFVDATTLTTTVLMAMAPVIVDVEVHRGEEMSDVLTFEFTAVAGMQSRKEAERKPRKDTPASKRLKSRR
jgi:hypothetical protein